MGRRVRVAVFCHECGKRHPLEKPKEFGEKVLMICHQCEARIEVDWRTAGQDGGPEVISA